MEIILLVIRLLLFGIFALAGVGKLLDLGGSEKAVKEFGVPEPIAKPVGILLPIAELVFAFCFLFTATSWVGAIGGLLLMTAFIGGMLVQMMRGKAADCHCFGQIHSEPVGWKSLVRNIIIGILPIVLIASGRVNQGFPLGQTDGQIASNTAVAIVAVAVAVVASYLVRLSEENRKLGRRVQFLELIENGGNAVERDEVGDPTDSLPIGAPLPDFQLPDTAGRVITAEHMLVDGLPKLFVFVSPTCEPCKAMIPDFEAWRKEFDGRIKFILVSKGSVKDNNERFGADLSNGMLLEKNTEFSKKLYVTWTPTALLVSADGTIASRPAVGDSGISDLIGQLRREDFRKEGYHIANGQKPGRVKIGEVVPEFSLPAVAGGEITNEFFSGSSTLAIFLSTTCGHCSQLVDDIRRWESSPERNGTKVIIFSDGDLETHRSYGLSTPIILDKRYSVAGRMGMFGAPSAVLVDENGKIVSETAVGGPMVWALIGKNDQ